MRALQLSAPGPVSTAPLRLVELPAPSPAPGEIVIAVSACAVCRTDLQLVEGDLPSRPLPVVPGHQAVGRVAEVGEGVFDWRPGDMAGVGWVAGTCGTCGFCASGRENLCPAARFTGWDRDGGYAELIAVDAGFALRLPAGFDDPLDAAPLLCGGVIGYRSLKVSGIEPGGRLGLFGFGASAHLALQVARYWGCEVHVRTRSSREQERAMTVGAASAGGYDEPTPPLDAAVTFAPSGAVVVAALRNLERGGVVAINAIHLDRIPEFPYDLLWLERSVRSVANFTRSDARELLALASAIPIRTDIEVFALADANGALRRLSSGELRATAVLDTTEPGRPRRQDEGEQDGSVEPVPPTLDRVRRPGEALVERSDPASRRRADMTEPVRHQELEGVSWHLTHGVPIPAGVTITARFVDGTVAGHAAVNRYRAQYQSERGGLSIGPGATTMMAGAPDAMAAERAYLTLLESVVAYRIGPDGRSLILSDRAGDDILWYVAAPDVSDALLGRWDVRFVRRGSALASPALSGTRPYLEFDGAGQVSGHGAVNRLHGTVRVDGDRLWLGPLASTRMAGPADAMESEDALLAALDHVAAFRIDGHALYLIDADGQTRVQLERPEGGR